MKYSVSRIKLFKACRRAYELKYIEGLEPVERAEALETGLTYHGLLEQFYRGDPVDADNSKECVMAQAYMKYIGPKVPEAETEKWFEKGDFHGRVDGITPDGCILEHKTTSAEITEEYEYNIQWDEQVLTYMWLTGLRKCYYTVCRKPTIRQKKNESDEEFFRRMLEWYEEDTDKKIRLFVVRHSDSEVDDFIEDLKETISEIRECKHYYRNCLHCSHWGRRCEYESICRTYDPNQAYVGFVKKENL